MSRDEWNIVDSHHHSIHDVFSMNISEFNDFIEQLPSEIGLLTGLTDLLLGKWK